MKMKRQKKDDQIKVMHCCNNCKKLAIIVNITILESSFLKYYLEMMTNFSMLLHFKSYLQFDISVIDL